jgi:hypothetical protein
VSERAREQGPREPSECVTCDQGFPRNECPASERPCGHHCNHSWSHEVCDWCGAKFEGEECVMPAEGSR